MVHSYKESRMQTDDCILFGCNISYYLMPFYDMYDPKSQVQMTECNSNRSTADQMTDLSW